ncbi:MAG: hypothetical protein ACOCRX_11090 [Candidatus Woesearchaeota archaeon]
MYDIIEKNKPFVYGTIGALIGYAVGNIIGSYSLPIVIGGVACALLGTPKEELNLD